MPFAIRKFDTARPLGETLKTLRKSAKVTLTELEKKTKIRRCYLEALEKNDYAHLPEPLYTRKFVKTYVTALGGNEKYFLERYEEERGTCDLISPTRLPRARARAIQFLVASKFLKICVIGIVALLLFSYLGLQMRAIVSAPALMITLPKDGWQTQQATVHVEGRVQENARVEINGDPVLLNEDGTFTHEVALRRGLNLVTIRAKKRYSRTSEVFRRVIFEQKN